MIRLNRIVESAILSALDLSVYDVKPIGVRYMIDNNCPMIVMFYAGDTLPKSDKYHRMTTIDGTNAIAVMVDILSSKYEDEKLHIYYED